MFVFILVSLIGVLQAMPPSIGGGDGMSIMEVVLTSGAIVQPTPPPYPLIPETTTSTTTTTPPPPPPTTPTSGTPNFARPIENVTVPLGREAILTCSVTDLMNYKVGWLKEADQTILALDKRVVTGNPRVSVTYDGQHTWQLHLRAVRKEDRGCYICQINTQEMKMQTGCIDVQEPPDITDNGTSSDVTLLEDHDVTLECNAMGHPKPKITWRREGPQQLVIRKGNTVSKVDSLTADTLSLVKVKRTQMGAYLCIASNDVPPAVSKRITLNVNFPPTVRAATELLGAPVGTTVTLVCKVEAFPNTVNTWMFKPKENTNLRFMVGSGPRHILSEKRDGYNVTMNLTIANVTKSDMGVYFCNASNSLGKAESAVRIYEIVVPTTPPPTTTTTVRIRTKPPTTTTTTTTTTEPPWLLNPTTRQQVYEWPPRSTKSPLDQMMKPTGDDEPSMHLDHEVRSDASQRAGARESSGTPSAHRTAFTTILVCTLTAILLTVR